MRGTGKQIVYLGTYERDYPRNALVIAALRRAGFSVREIHIPVWERTRDKTGGFLALGSLARLAVRLGSAYIRLAARLARVASQNDAVVIGYPGQFDMLLLAPLARLARRPVIFNPLVTLTDTLVEDRAIIPEGSLLARGVAVLDWVALRLASLILVDTPENGAYLTARFGVASARIAHLDVGADDRLFRPPDAPEPPTEGLRVLFYGKFTPLHGIETIIQAASALRDEPDITFEIIGGGQTAAAMHDLARRLHVTTIDWVPWVPFERLPERISAADVVLGVFGGGAKPGRVVPNKVFQAMAMGAAIVTRDSPAIRRVLRDGESALLVPPDDAEALAAAITRLRDPVLRHHLGSNARRSFEAFGSLDALARRLADIVPTLLDRRVPRAERLEGET